MKLTVSDATDMHRVFEGVTFPPEMQELHLQCEAWRYVNCFLGSSLNARVTAEFPDRPINLAGMFARCRELESQPRLDTTQATSMAAMFKECEDMRFSTHWIKTDNCRDFRQMFWGCTSSMGNGPQRWNFTAARSPDAFRNFFGGGSGMASVYYNEFLRHVHAQMRAGTLPTPMSPVDMGESKFTEYARQYREELIEYGWDIKDAGQITIDLSETEKTFSRSVDDAIKTHGDQWIDAIDCSPVVKSSRNGTLITPRHTVHVNHYAPPIGHVVRFWRGETATVTAVARHPSADLCIATLDRDMEIRPAQLLSKEWTGKMPHAGGPPTQYPAGDAPPLVYFSDGNASKPPGLNDLSYVAASTSTGFVYPCWNEARAKYPASIQVGDSGSSVCFLKGDRLVLAWPLQSGGGTGPWLADYREWIDGVVQRDGCDVKDVSCPTL